MRHTKVSQEVHRLELNRPRLRISVHVDRRAGSRAVAIVLGMEVRQKVADKLAEIHGSREWICEVIRV